MAEPGTFRDEVQRAATRFWGTSWKVKGPVLGFIGLVAIAGIGNAIDGGAGGDGARSSFIDTTPGNDSATATLEADQTSAAESTPRPEGTQTPETTHEPEPSATPAGAAPTANPTTTQAATATQPPPTPTTAAATNTPPPPTPTLTPEPDYICTASASVSDTNPQKNSNITLTGVLSCSQGSPGGAILSSEWHFKSTTTGCDATAAPNGVANCTRGIGNASSGYTVQIDVTMTKDGHRWSASTSFTPQ